MVAAMRTVVALSTTTVSFPLGSARGSRPMPTTTTTSAPLRQAPAADRSRVTELVGQPPSPRTHHPAGRNRASATHLRPWRSRSISRLVLLARRDDDHFWTEARDRRHGGRRVRHARGQHAHATRHPDGSLRQLPRLGFPVLIRTQARTGQLITLPPGEGTRADPGSRRATAGALRMPPRSFPAPGRGLSDCSRPGRTTPAPGSLSPSRPQGRSSAALCA